ncbi:MAG TPA: hypothetical protein VKB25_04170 [Conexibacter sp.]|nr:hypothetical protein [Conexibacter sp.]
MGVLAGIVAALTLAFAVDAAPAARLSLSNRNFRITWRELKFFDVAGPSTVCPVTMEGSFHSATMRKVIRALIGYITRATVNEAACVGEGRARFLQATLPWHITYASFSGTLPAITRMRVLISGISYESVLNTIPCLFRGEGTLIGGEFIREAGGAITGFEFDHSTTLPPLPGVCEDFGINGGLERVGTVALLGTTTRITLTLI